MKGLLLSLLITLVLLGCDTKTNQVPQTPKEAAVEFLTAYSNEDAKKITEMLDIIELRKVPELQNGKDIRKQAEKELERFFVKVGDLQHFEWEILTVERKSDEECAIRFKFKMNSESKKKFDEDVLQAVKRKGKWYFKLEPLF